MNLTQQQIGIFVSVAHWGSISRAAEMLKLAEPRLNDALADLEEQLGARLWFRSTQKIRLTQAGETYLPWARRLLHEMESTPSLLVGDGLDGKVSLCVGTAFGCAVLPTVMQTFGQSHPRVRVVINDQNSAVITAQVASGAVDIGIGSPIGDTSGLEVQMLLMAPLGLLGDPVRFDLHNAVAQKNFSKLPLFKEPADTSIVDVLHRHGSELVTLMQQGTELSSLALQLAFANANIGVALMSALGASHPQATSLEFVALNPVFYREIFVFWRKDPEPSAAAKEFVRHVLMGVKSAILHSSIKCLT